jgi:L-lactate dehydrogenase (cytochrome)
MRLDHCFNTPQFRRLAKKRLPGPIFHYIDGAADDEVTYRRNTEAYETCDLVPNVLAGVETIDMSTTVMGMKLDLPIFLSPTALQRLFHYDGERAVGRAAEEHGTLFGISSLATVSIEEIGDSIKTPKMFQLYYHKDKELTYGMIERCKSLVATASETSLQDSLRHRGSPRGVSRVLHCTLDGRSITCSENRSSCRT